MSKAKSITTLIKELEAENTSLKHLERIANQYCRLEFGCSQKELHEKLLKLQMYERKAAEINQQQARHITLNHQEKSSV